MPDGTSQSLNLQTLYHLIRFVNCPPSSTESRPVSIIRDEAVGWAVLTYTCTRHIATTDDLSAQPTLRSDRQFDCLVSKY